MVDYSVVIAILSSLQMKQLKCKEIMGIIQGHLDGRW